MIELNNKVVLITGGSRGIESAIAKIMARVSATVAFTYSSNAKQAERTADEVARLGSECLTIQSNSAHPADVQKTIEAVLKNFGRIDILVNNAGIWKRDELGKMQEEQ